ncbi:sensor histidine kinase [Paenibacillus wulumuqiensis]|uniref:sensor histidine kinase n=1 Tax=Paenibacillus wulumuqiensis TaxID=1567107 RepID=UPI00061982F4|nr:HAMP domain-containing sensor histidine kinase [Paenibacillus wulumuqiensis]
MKWKITSLYVGSYIVLLGLFLIMYTAAVFYFVDHGSRFSPVKMTLDFQQYIGADSQNQPVIQQAGIELLKQHNAWIQLLDENGTEITAWNKPADAPAHYTPSRLVFINKFSVNGSTIFTGVKEWKNREWSYLIAFPETQVSKYPINYEPRYMFNSLFTIFIVLVISILLIGYLFGSLLSRPMWKLIQGITRLSLRDYSVRYHTKGLYHNVYESLNTLSDKLQDYEREQQQMETMREEWIANLYHDLKTPLSSIQGYAELMNDSGVSINMEERVKYSGIIAQNATQLEGLLDDLKLTYRLKNNILPLTMHDEDLAEVIRETVIQLLNTPVYMEREIHLEIEEEPLHMMLDHKWMQRALNNLILNALVHNPPATVIRIEVSDHHQHIEVQIRDNGKGIDSEEQERLFERHYRVTDAAQPTSGSGLGLTIARQIVEAHGGSITLQSTLGQGTVVTLLFPRNYSIQANFVKKSRDYC